MNRQSMVVISLIGDITAIDCIFIIKIWADTIFMVIHIVSYWYC